MTKESGGSDPWIAREGKKGYDKRNNNWSLLQCEALSWRRRGVKMMNWSVLIAIFIKLTKKMLKKRWSAKPQITLFRYQRVNWPVRLRNGFIACHDVQVEAWGLTWCPTTASTTSTPSRSSLRHWQFQQHSIVSLTVILHLYPISSHYRSQRRYPNQTPFHAFQVSFTRASSI